MTERVIKLLSVKSPARNSKCQLKTYFKTDFVQYVNVCFACLLINVLATPSPFYRVCFVCLGHFEGFFFIKLLFPHHFFLPPILSLSLSGHVS